jgi:ribosome biogenesis protein ERB1
MEKETGSRCAGYCWPPATGARRHSKWAAQVTEGGRLDRKGRADKLDSVLARADSGKALRTIYDEYNDEEITLTKDELRMIMRVREGRFPHVEVNPYEPTVEWFSSEVEEMPISAAPEPKRRFIPSKWEEKKIVKNLGKKTGAKEEKNDLADLHEEKHGKPNTPMVTDDDLPYDGDDELPDVPKKKGKK